jgi:hypothetical protein
MTAAQILLPGALLALAALLPWCLRWVLRASERSDAPSAALARASAAANIAIAVLLLLLARNGGRLVTLGHLWRHDPWSALLLGALAGLFLHFAGSGSPLPIASLRWPHARQRSGALLFVLGAAASVAIWFGVGVPSLLIRLPRLPSLLLVGSGYGLARGGAGQDHVVLGAIDGLLLGLLAILSGSVVAVLLAQLVADVWAYVSAAAQAEDLALAVEAGEPNLPDERRKPHEFPEDRVERLA